jgi:hypothetical protein
MHGYARLINSTVAFVAALFLAITLNVESLGVAGGVPWVGIGLVAVLVVLRAAKLTHGVGL